MGEQKKLIPEQQEEEDKEKEALISLLYKSCRIGDVKTAILTAERLKRITSEYYIARTLIQLVGEDCSPEEWQRLYPSLTAYIDNVEHKRQRGHDMWHAVYAVAKAKKWYQTEEGKELEDIRQVARQKELPNPTFKDWVFDQHTREGWKRFKNHTQDFRLSGKWENRYNIRDKWLEITRDAPTYKEKVEKWISYWNK